MKISKIFLVLSIITNFVLILIILNIEQHVGIKRYTTRATTSILLNLLRDRELHERILDTNKRAVRINRFPYLTEFYPEKEFPNWIDFYINYYIDGEFPNLDLYSNMEIVQFKLKNNYAIIGYRLDKFNGDSRLIKTKGDWKVEITTLEPRW